MVSTNASGRSGISELQDRSLERSAAIKSSKEEEQDGQIITDHRGAGAASEHVVPGLTA